MNFLPNVFIYRKMQRKISSDGLFYFECFITQNIEVFFFEVLARFEV